MSRRGKQPASMKFKGKPRFGEDHYKGGEGGMLVDKFHPRVENEPWTQAVLSRDWGFSGFTGEYFPNDQTFSHIYAKPTKGDYARSLDIPVISCKLLCTTFNCCMHFTQEMPELALRKAKERMLAEDEAPKTTYKEGTKLRTLDALNEKLASLLTVYPSGPGWSSTFTKPVRIDKEKDPQDLLEEIFKILGPGMAETYFFMMFQGKKLVRGKPLRKQGLTGKHDKDGKQFYRILLCQLPKATEETEIVFRVQQHSFLYDFHDDPDVCDAYTGEIKVNRAAKHNAGDELVDLHYDPSASASANKLRTF
jgi:hypothetical protein